MATETINYKLKKPAQEDFYNVDDFNNNADTIDNVISEHTKDYINHVPYGSATGANTKAVALNPVPSDLIEGLALSFKNIIANTGAVTLNVNGLGAKPVIKSNGNAMSSGNLKAGSIYTVRYSGTSFILQGEGEYGTAIAANVLSPYTIGTENGIVNGTIPSKSAQTFTPGIANQTIASGQYLSGVQTLLGDADLIASNIKSGINVFGVNGTVIPKPTKVRSFEVKSPKWEVLLNNTITGLTGNILEYDIDKAGVYCFVLTTTILAKVTISNGSIVWSYPIVHSGSGQFVVADADGSVHTYDNGHHLKLNSSGSLVFKVLTMNVSIGLAWGVDHDDTHIYISNQTGMRKISKLDGSIIWTYTYTSTPTSFGSRLSAIKIHGGYVFGFQAYGYIYRLTLNGTLSKKSSYGGFRIETTVAVDNEGIFYSSGEGGAIYDIDATGIQSLSGDDYSLSRKKSVVNDKNYNVYYGVASYDLIGEIDTHGRARSSSVNMLNIEPTYNGQLSIKVDDLGYIYSLSGLMAVNGIKLLKLDCIYTLL